MSSKATPKKKAKHQLAFAKAEASKIKNWKRQQAKLQRKAEKAGKPFAPKYATFDAWYKACKDGGSKGRDAAREQRQAERARLREKGAGKGREE